nr:phosphoacetylglucosamine mutase [Tanacetum cinerariifolium]
MSVSNYEWHEFFPNGKILGISNINMIVILLIFGYDILYLFEEINDIFSKKRKKPEQQNTKKSDKRTRKDSKHDDTVPRREKLSKIEGSNVDMFESKKPARTKKKTTDGLVIYLEEELGFGKLDAGGLENKNAAKRLWAVTKLTNQVVGDALSGLLLVEAILQHMGWPVDKWNELYHDLPSRQLKFMLLMQDLMLPVVISYVNAAIDTTAIGFKRRRFDFALDIKTLVVATERRETPIDVIIKGLGLGCIFTLTAIAK